MMGSEVDVEPYLPYLEPDEVITSVNILGISRELSEGVGKTKACSLTVGITDCAEEAETTELQVDKNMAKQSNLKIDDQKSQLEKLNDESERGQESVSDNNVHVATDQMHEYISKLTIDNGELRKKLLELETRLAQFQAAKQQAIEAQTNGEGHPGYFLPAPNPYLPSLAPCPSLPSTHLHSYTHYPFFPHLK